MLPCHALEHTPDLERLKPQSDATGLLLASQAKESCSIPGIVQFALCIRLLTLRNTNALIHPSTRSIFRHRFTKYNPVMIPSE